MRAYYFGNMYLSSIQQGIQAAHVTTEMFVKYTPTCGRIKTKEYKMLLDWAATHKTMILLNAGYGAEIHSLVDFFSRDDNPYPWCQFHEEEAALDGAITSVGIILPERIYETASLLRSKTFPHALLNTKATEIWNNNVPDDFNKWELSWLEQHNNFGMAR